MMRRLRNAINPLSTSFSRWWCRSSLRAVLNGRPSGAARRLTARRRRIEGRISSLDERVNRARSGAIDEMIAEDGPESLRP